MQVAYRTSNSMFVIPEPIGDYSRCRDTEYKADDRFQGHTEPPIQIASLSSNMYFVQLIQVYCYTIYFAQRSRNHTRSEISNSLYLVDRPVTTRFRSTPATEA